tara:strand:+ start:65 stop:931 length:867 start_codon:yes stop_codon:yes gene_type:complete
MIYTANDPGNWAIWKTKEGNKDLPLQEATQKYRKEKLLFEQQYMDFVATQEAIQRQQAQTGGTSLNGVTSVTFDASPVFQTNTGNTQTLKVKFSKPVLVTGSPLVTVANNQFGGGAAATFNYTYSAGSSTNELTFQHIHPTAAVASQGFSANIVALGSNLAPVGIIVQPGTPTDGDYTFSADTDYTTSGDGNGLSLQVTIDGSQITRVICTTTGNDFIPGEIITFGAGSLGASSTGGSITVATSALLADTVSFASGSAITLNSGSIKTANLTPTLTFTSTSTKTGVAS